MAKAKFYKKGTIRNRSNGTSFSTKADLYEIENNKLINVDNIDDLQNKLEFLNTNQKIY